MISWFCFLNYGKTAQESEPYKNFWPQDQTTRKTVVIDSQIHQPQNSSKDSDVSGKGVDNSTPMKETKHSSLTKSPVSDVESKEVNPKSTLSPHNTSNEIQIPVSYEHVSRASSCNSLSSSGGSMNEYDIEKASKTPLPSTPVDQSSIKGIRKITITANCSVLDEPYDEPDTPPKQKVLEDQFQTVKIYILFSIEIL